VHLVVGCVLAVVWVVLIAFVLTHGKDDLSSVDVYSELPPGFTTALQQQGVTYAGLSPVDGSTVQQAMTHATTDSRLMGDGTPIVLRTSFSDRRKGASFTDQPALMVVVPDTQAGASGGGSGAVFVAFLDPTTYQTLSSLTYGGSASSR
jgi:hypothetical protein